MINFKAIDWIRIDGRDCAVVECDRERDRDNTGLVGETVSVDGAVYVCTGVERHMPNIPIHKGEKIVLMLDRKNGMMRK